MFHYFILVYRGSFWFNVKDLRLCFLFFFNAIILPVFSTIFFIIRYN